MLASIFQPLSHVDATLSLVAAAIFVALTQFVRPRRGPVSRRRLMEAMLSALLLFTLAIRAAVFTVAVALTPAAVLGQDRGDLAAPLAAGLAAGLAVLGFAAYRGPVSLRVSGAAALFAAAVADAAASLFALDLPAVAQVDAAAGVAIASAAVILAAFHWTHRLAAPNPLGGDKRPLDY